MNSLLKIQKMSPWSLIPLIKMLLDQLWEHRSTGVIKILSTISQIYNHIETVIEKYMAMKQLNNLNNCCQ